MLSGTLQSKGPLKIRDVHNGSDEKEILFYSDEGEIRVDCEKE